jgi:hypothetical protein
MRDPRKREILNYKASKSVQSFIAFSSDHARTAHHHWILINHTSFLSPGMGIHASLSFGEEELLLCN